MQFFVYSRGAVEAIKPFDEPHAFISIVTPPADTDFPKLPRNDHTFETLRLVFDDVDQVRREDDVLFTRDLAQAVWTFVLAARKAEVETFVLHCDAGQCRSPAVAAAISKVFTGDDSSFFKRYRPNMLVFRTLLDTWYDDFEVEVEEPL
jgi:predicted protein tyrosine phosphatase